MYVKFAGWQFTTHESVLLERREAFGLGERKNQGPNGHFRKLSTHFVSCSVCVFVIVILFLLVLSLLDVCLHLLEEFAFWLSGAGLQGCWLQC